MTADDALAPLHRIGWRGPLPAASTGRVVAQHRAGYELHNGLNLFDAQPDGHFLKRGLDPSLRPAVGDFVELDDRSGEQRILTVLPRRSSLIRAASGERYQRQVIATNVDYVLVLTGLDGDFNPRRIERYLLLIEGSGAQPVVLLTKADTCTDTDAALNLLAERLPPRTPVHAINAKSATSITQLKAYLGPGCTAVLVGSSGAGKSSLTNTLLGTQRMATGTVRASDSRGRHTTSHRALLMLPSGGCLIDTPGMRELKLIGDENLDLFADIEALVLRCRFSDCRHGNEPGCAVQAALASDDLDAERWRNYIKLHDEREQQAATLQARLRKAEHAGKAHASALSRRQRDRFSRD